MSKQSFFARLMSSTAVTAAAASGDSPAADPGNEPAAAGSSLTEARVEAALQAAHAEGEAAGATAERERTAAVFASAEGQANMGMAAWMLANNPTASAEAISAQLKTLPAQAVASGPGQQAEAAPLTTPLEQTPAADLTGQKPAGTATDGASGEPSADKLWDQVQAEGRERFYGSAAGTPAVAAGGQPNVFQPRTGY